MRRFFKQKQQIYSDLGSKPNLPPDKIQINCEWNPNSSECAQRYSPLGFDPHNRAEPAFTIMKKVHMEEGDQKTIRQKLEQIKSARRKYEMDIEAVRIEAIRREEIPFSEETKQKIKFSKDKLELLLTKQLPYIEIVGTASDINKMAQVKASLSDALEAERDAEIDKIKKLLLTYGGRKRKTKRIKKKRTKRLK